MEKIGIIGGGAAGFFLAANLKKEIGKETILFEQAKTPLQKVRISGGGRCNVTHACFDPLDLVEFYPRGKRELLSVFYQFQPGDTMEWFSSRGVELKIEEDNRVFPVSNNSLSIVDCLIKHAKDNLITLKLSDGVQSINHKNNLFEVVSNSGTYYFNKLIITTGSTPKTWKLIKNLGHNIVAPVPSLFTFNCKDPRLKDLMGISFNNASVKIINEKLETEGPLLITHWGFSGPSILKLSAWGANILHDNNYNFSVEINFIGKTKEEAIEVISLKKQTDAKKQIYKYNPFDFPKRFWISILNFLKIKEDLHFADLSKNQINLIATELTESKYKITGKSTFKEEFVTAGGVDLKEIDFRTMESKLIPNLFFAGETLNIDAITGGFNFQACWSEAFLISNKINQL